MKTSKEVKWERCRNIIRHSHDIGASHNIHYKCTYWKKKNGNNKSLNKSIFSAIYLVVLLFYSFIYSTESTLWMITIMMMMIFMRSFITMFSEHNLNFKKSFHKIKALKENKNEGKKRRIEWEKNYHNILLLLL